MTHFMCHCHALHVGIKRQTVACLCACNWVDSDELTCVTLAFCAAQASEVLSELFPHLPMSSVRGTKRPRATARAAQSERFIDSYVMYQRIASAMGVELGDAELHARLESSVLNHTNAENSGAEAEELEKLELRTKIVEAELRKNIRTERVELQRRLDKIMQKAKEGVQAARRTGQALMDAERAAQTSGRNATAIAAQQQLQCKNCGNQDGAYFVTDGWNADLICRKCGNIVRANQIQDKDWSRVKTSDDGKVMSTIGDKHDKRFGDSHNLRVNLAGGPGVNASTLRSMQRSAAYMEQIHHSDSVHRGHATGRTRDVFKDKDKRKIFDRLEDVSSRVGINMGVCNSAKDMYAAVRDDREALHKRDKMAVVCLFTAWQQMVQQHSESQTQMLARAAAAQTSGGDASMPPPAKRAAEADPAVDDGFSLMSLLGDAPLDTPSTQEAQNAGAVPAAATEEAASDETTGDAQQLSADDSEDEDALFPEAVQLQRRHARAVAAVKRHTAAAAAAQGQLIAARAAERAWAQLQASKEAVAESATVSAAAAEESNPHSSKATEAEMRVAAASGERAAAVQQEEVARTALDSFTKSHELKLMAHEDDFCRRVSHPFWASYDARVRQVAAMRKRNQKMRFMDLSKPPKRRMGGAR